MLRRGSVLGAVAAAVLCALPVSAEGHRPGAVAIWSAEVCLSLGDAAFEHALRDGVAQADQGALRAVFEAATFECLGLSMEICEGLEDGLACLGDLAVWVREDRAAIVALLPESLEDEAYRQALAHAAAGADEASCSEMSDAQRARYCDVVSEGIALEDAYAAWRLARREGAVDLVGHDPVDLEMIR